MPVGASGYSVRIASQRGLRQSIFLTVTASGLMMGLLVLGAAWSIAELSYRDKSPAWMLWEALGRR